MGETKRPKATYFFDLLVWKEAHELVLLIYKLVESLPKKERFILSSQMLRAVISITSNIAEGFGRRGLKEKVQSYTISRASLVELQNQLIICKDIKYISVKRFNVIWEQTVVVHKMLNALIKSIRNR